MISPFFDWSDDRHPRTPWHDTVVYEAHVKGISATHPDIPPEVRGTYLGLCSQPVLDHLKALGVTAVELMPVHQFVNDYRLDELGLRNYWGYNSIAYLAPHGAYAVYGQQGQQVQEFKQMVKTLHREGIEVILDVVYNHTAEGNDAGPVLSLKGADNAAYYRLSPEDRRRYVDYTGTGNSLNMRHPHVLQLIMDSLRYWVTEMHVDGFRFDLAATLARELHDVDKLSSFFDLIQQDPIVSQAKLIAEPWDVGEGGYQVGNFPALWSEWNGKYRDEVRDFWRGAEHSVAEFGYRFTGSSDLYQPNGRTPVRVDQLRHLPRRLHRHRPRLVQRQAQRRQRRGQQRRHDDNRSWNCGAEGPDRRRGREPPPPAAAPQPAGHPPAQPGRTHAARGRRARPHPAGQQQRLLPGQRDLVVRLVTEGRRAARVRPPPHRAPPPAPHVPTATVLPGPADPGRRTSTTSGGSRRTASA